MASFSVVNNIMSVNAQSKLYMTNVGLQKTLARLSSGLRINNSGDDAAGLAVANGMRSQIAVLNVGVRNANDGLSTLQIADGALNNISQLLDRATTLASQAASDLFSGNRATLNDEFKNVVAEIDREAGLGGLTSGLNSTVYVAPGTSGQVGVSFGAVSSTTLTIATSDINTAAAAQSAVTAIGTAVSTLGGIQGSVGSSQNRLQFAISLAQNQIVNVSAAESRIRDANIAEESANLTRYNILTQSGLASLAQANQSTQSVLALLR